MPQEERQALLPQRLESLSYSLQRIRRFPGGLAGEERHWTFLFVSLEKVIVDLSYAMTDGLPWREGKVISGMGERIKTEASENAQD